MPEVMQSVEYKDKLKKFDQYDLDGLKFLIDNGRENGRRMELWSSFRLKFKSNQ